MLIQLLYIWGGGGGVLMGLTQVMLQVKGCEMVCKQRELIPRLKAIVNQPVSLQLNSYFPPPPPLLPPSQPPILLLLLLLLLLPLPRPACQIASDTVQQRLSGAIKKVPKHGVKCRPLTKMRVGSGSI